MPLLVLRVVLPTLGAFALVRWARRRDDVVLNAAVWALAFVAVGWMGVAATNTTVALG